VIENLRKFKRVINGRDFFFKKTLRVCDKKIGSKYGGWWIATDDLSDKFLTVFSFGLGEDISFDIKMLKKYNCKVYGFDPTPKSIKYIESKNLNDNFMLYKYALSDKNGTLIFNLPENKKHVSGSLENIPSGSQVEVTCKNLKTICKEIGVNEIDILKMDIEGSEYKVIEKMMDQKIFPKQILIEYHHFFDSFDNNTTRNNIKLLLNNGYDLFHIDGYNYSFLLNK
jgi:FkbM family methyltransferase